MCKYRAILCLTSTVDVYLIQIDNLLINFGPNRICFLFSHGRMNISILYFKCKARSPKDITALTLIFKTELAKNQFGAVKSTNLLIDNSIILIKSPNSS